MIVLKKSFSVIGKLLSFIVEERISYAQRQVNAYRESVGTNGPQVTLF